MNKRGFAVSGIIYSILILFLILVFSILAILGSRKLIIDKFKNDTLNKIYGNESEEQLIYTDNSGANSPELLNNMIPVYYDGSNWIYADIKKEWYDYDKKEWANAVVLNNDLSKNVGDPISEDEIALWYVWIPRYTYTIFNGNNECVEEQEIQIKFESGTNSSGTVECVDTISGNGTISETCTDNTNGSIKNGTSTYAHPAFTFGEQELRGFWVGKFEVSGSTNQITIKPNVSSLRNQTVSSFFNSILNIKTSYNINGDSHMMKNMEWGAVAYLSHSKYGTCTDGKCVEVGINNNSSYITGCGAHPGNSASNACNAYNTVTGMLASTTQNIYGVYDMSGGAWESIMSSIVTSNGDFYNSDAGFTSTKLPDSKYYEKYTYDSITTTFSRGKLGDATKEVLVNLDTTTSGWYNDSSYLPTTNSSWFARSQNYDVGQNAGIFVFGRTGGATQTHISTRAVLVK